MSDPRPPSRQLDSHATRVLAAALHYAAIGQPVFPCYPADVTNSDGSINRAKTPLTTHGFHDATLNREKITHWWNRLPAAAIGLPTGLRWDVLDVDNHAGGVNGYTALGALDKAGLLEGAIGFVRTPSDGLHVYFPINPEDPMGNATWGTVGIDLRGKGGYVIAPPTCIRTSTGEEGFYEVLPAVLGPGAPLDWKAVRRLLVGDPPAPSTHPEGVSQPRPSVSRRSGGWGIEPLARTVREAEVGERNSILYWAACRAAEQDLDPEPLSDAALEVGLEPDKVERTIASAAKKTEEERGSR